MDNDHVAVYDDRGGRVEKGQGGERGTCIRHWRILQWSSLKETGC